MTPLDLTSAFGVFAAGGRLVTPHGMTSVSDQDDAEVFATTPDQRRVVSEDVAFQMVSMLRDVVDRGTGSAARTLGVRGPVGGKTGTTNDYRDAWFVGFSSSVVAGVWVGFDQPAPIGPNAYAARVAVPIWADFMKRTATARPASEFAVPDGIQTVELCSVTYQRPVDGCPKYVEYFKADDSQPSALCTIHEGSVSQRAQRAVGGFFHSIGGRIAGLFGRKK